MRLISVIFAALLLSSSAEAASSVPSQWRQVDASFASLLEHDYRITAMIQNDIGNSGPAVLLTKGPTVIRCSLYAIAPASPCAMLVPPFQRNLDGKSEPLLPAP